jgi:hypothetical protein
VFTARHELNLIIVYNLFSQQHTLVTHRDEQLQMNLICNSGEICSFKGLRAGAFGPETQFSGAFAKLRKASSCLSVNIERLGSHWVDFHEILYSYIVFQPVEKIYVTLISERNNGYFT